MVVQRLTRIAASVPVVALMLGLGSVTVDRGGVIRSVCAASSARHTALVIEHGDGRTARECIGFDGASITAEDALRTGNVEYGTSAYGGALGDAVCQVDSEPLTYPPGCFGSSGNYWALFIARHGGGWRPSPQGISGVSLSDGDALGLRYEAQGGVLQPPPAAARVCTSPPAAGASQPAAPNGLSSLTPAGTTSTPGPGAGMLVATVALAALLGMLGVSHARRGGDT